MAILDTIVADLKEAMLSRQSEKTGVLRMVKAEIQNATIKAGQPLSDAEVITVLRKEVKKREETAALYRQNTQNERAEAELAEATILSAYLPASLDAAVLESFLKAEIVALGTPFESRHKGVLIKAAISKFGDQVDGRQISAALDRIVG